METSLLQQCVILIGLKFVMSENAPKAWLNEDFGSSSTGIKLTS